MSVNILKVGDVVRFKSPFYIKTQFVVVNITTQGVQVLPLEYQHWATYQSLLPVSADILEKEQ